MPKTKGKLNIASLFLLSICQMPQSSRTYSVVLASSMSLSSAFRLDVRRRRVLVRLTLRFGLVSSPSLSATGDGAGADPSADISTIGCSAALKSTAELLASGFAFSSPPEDASSRVRLLGLRCAGLLLSISEGAAEFSALPELPGLPTFSALSAFSELSEADFSLGAAVLAAIILK